MKVGIYLGYGPLQGQAGGGATFQQSLLAALSTLSTSHELVIFYYGQQPPVYLTTSKISFVPITISPSTWWLKIVTKPWRMIQQWVVQKRYKSLLNAAVLKHDIDFMWFMTPGYEYVAVPYLYTIWDLQHRKQSYFPEVSVEDDQFSHRERIYREVIPRAAYVLTGTVVGRDELMHFYGLPSERVRLFALPTPDYALHTYQTQHPLNHKPYLFYPAQFWPHKHHVMFIDVLQKLDALGMVFDVVFTGSDKGNKAYVQSVIAEYGLQKRFHFLGFVDQDTLVRLYQHAYALVYPSWFGPDNIPPLEAFGLGCPVICADVDGVREQLGEAALFFNPYQVQEVVDALFLLRDDVVRKKYITLGQQRAARWTAHDYVHGVMMLCDQFSNVRRCWGPSRDWVEKG